MANENGFNGRAAVFFLTIGGLAGAALGTLFAPWEGRETRTKVKELAEEVKDLPQRLTSLGRAKKEGDLQHVEKIVEAPGKEEFEAQVTQPG